MEVEPTLSVRVCVQSGYLPSSHGSHLVCMSAAGSIELSADSMSVTKYFLYPHPGPWFIGFQANCSNTTVGYGCRSAACSVKIGSSTANVPFRNLSVDFIIAFGSLTSYLRSDKRIIETVLSFSQCSLSTIFPM